MSPELWAAIAKTVRPFIRDVTMDEDARAHAIATIPDYPNKPVNWRSSDDRWYIQCAKRAATKYVWKELRRGLKMRNGSEWQPFLELDAPVVIDDVEDTYHNTIPGHASPEAWLIAQETVNEYLAKRRKRAWLAG